MTCRLLFHHIQPFGQIRLNLNKPGTWVNLLPLMEQCPNDNKKNYLQNKSNSIHTFRLLTIHSNREGGSSHLVPVTNPDIISVVTERQVVDYDASIVVWRAIPLVTCDRTIDPDDVVIRQFVEDPNVSQTWSPDSNFRMHGCVELVCWLTENWYFNKTIGLFTSSKHNSKWFENYWISINPTFWILQSWL